MPYFAKQPGAAAPNVVPTRSSQPIAWVLPIQPLAYGPPSFGLWGSACPTCMVSGASDLVRRIWSLS